MKNSSVKKSLKKSKNVLEHAKTVKQTYICEQLIINTPTLLLLENQVGGMGERDWKVRVALHIMNLHLSEFVESNN